MLAYKAPLKAKKSVGAAPYTVIGKRSNLRGHAGFDTRAKNSAARWQEELFFTVVKNAVPVAVSCN